jgi:hypothetical protein
MSSGGESEDEDESIINSTLTELALLLLYGFMLVSMYFGGNANGQGSGPKPNEVVIDKKTLDELFIEKDRLSGLVDKIKEQLLESMRAQSLEKSKVLEAQLMDLTSNKFENEKNKPGKVTVDCQSNQGQAGNTARPIFSITSADRDYVILRLHEIPSGFDFSLFKINENSSGRFSWDELIEITKKMNEAGWKRTDQKCVYYADYRQRFVLRRPDKGLQLYDHVLKAPPPN